MKMETPISRVRGLGSARSGAHHWWLERLTSVATLLLVVWLLVSLLTLPDLAYGTMVEWLGSPLGAVPMLLLIVSTFWHAKLGLQVVVEDYVDDEGLKLFTITLVNFFIVALGATAFFSVLKIAFAGGAE
ncbi:MAG TPA: succinate dehydrogenase, hydrophobic membrane anchor protein [Sphingomicrobium sp.]